MTKEEKGFWNTKCKHKPIKPFAKHCQKESEYEKPKKGNHGRHGKHRANKGHYGCTKNCKYYEAEK